MPLNSPTAHLRSRRETPALVIVALAVFSVTATEMMPIGLLPDMAADLDVSEGVLGWSITGYGLLAGLLAPPLTAAFHRLDRRSLLLLILATFVVGNIITAVSPSYPVLLISRVLIGFIHGVMWSIVARVAVRLVEPRRAVQATAIVFSGISLALVLGVPLGTFIGQLAGWRAAFWVLAFLSALAAVLTMLLVPRLPAEAGLRLAALPPLLLHRNFRVALTVTSIVVVGNYAAYTYVTPFLIEYAHVDPDLISVLLLCYGTAGVLGNFAGGSAITRSGSLRGTMVAFVAMLTVSLVLLFPAGGSLVAVTILLAVWGASYSALPVILQTLVLRSVPESQEAASSLYVLAFNVSIALGAFVGGIGIDSAGVTAPLIIGLTMSAAAVLATFSVRRSPAPASSTRGVD